MRCPGVVRAPDSPPDASDAPGPIHGAVRSWSVGDRVRISRTRRPSGTWSRFVGRVGTVQCFDRASAGDIDHFPGRVYEVGVAIDDSPGHYTWFAADELALVGRAS